MRAPALASLMILAAAACGGPDEQLPIDGAVTVDAAAGDAQPDGPGPDAPPSKRCGGLLGEVCEADQYCDYPTDSCGAGDEQGTCKPRPVGCPDVLVFMANCACDGMVYGSECDVYAAGSDRNALGGCPVPPGSFACGYTQCDVANHYCQRQVSDIADEPDDYSCLTLPGCPSQFPTCACLAGEPCGAMCTGMGTTGLTLTCPGG
jgi:hypothetical protein